MPNYFSDYDTTVHFISEEELKRDHSGIPHGGFVIRSGKTGWNDENNHVIEYLSLIHIYVKATLEQVEQNTSGDNDELGDIDDEEDDTVNAGDPADGDDILNLSLIHISCYMLPS